MDIDIVKLDSSLIENIDKDAKNRYIVQSIVEVVRGFGLEVVAEKVHSQAIEDILSEIGVDYLQGYHIGKPSASLLE